MLGQSGGTVALTPELFDKKCGIFSHNLTNNKVWHVIQVQHIQKSHLCLFLGRENQVFMISVSKNGLKKATFDNFGITIEVLKVNKMTFLFLKCIPL